MVPNPIKKTRPKRLFVWKTAPIWCGVKETTAGLTVQKVPEKWPIYCPTNSLQFADDCLTTTWRVPNDCLTTAWRLPDDCLKNAWWLPEGCVMTAWRIRDDCLSTAWQLPDDSETSAWQLHNFSKGQLKIKTDESHKGVDWHQITWRQQTKNYEAALRTRTAKKKLKQN